MFFCYAVTHASLDPNEHWESSCGRVGVFYGVSKIGDREDIDIEELIAKASSKVVPKVDNILVCKMHFRRS